MKAIVFIVEGETENEFVKRIITPYLTSKGICNCTPISITMSGGGHGFNNIEHLKNTIKPVLNWKDEPIITTFIDHYRLNSETKLPGYSECVREKDIEQKLSKMESKLDGEVQKLKPYRFFIPYIQRHEFETLLFADPQNGFEYEDDDIGKAVVDLCNSFASVEDINCTPEGAPSVRLSQIYANCKKRYRKASSAVDIAELTTIEKMFEKCPRFKKWIDELVNRALTL